MSMKKRVIRTSMEHPSTEPEPINIPVKMVEV